jgi:hypothetical protein
MAFLSLAVSLGDPDQEIARLCREGVPIGYKEDLVACPAIWPQKSRWKLPEEDMWNHSAINSNYGSTDEHEDILVSEFEKQIQNGMMISTTLGEAKAKFGERLRIAAMGLIPEKEAYRVIHDGTNFVNINNFIKVPDHELFPSGADVAASLQEDQDHQGLVNPRYISLKTDVSKAHRRVPVKEADWGLLGCAVTKLQKDPQGKLLDSNPVFLNVCGTYGIGSASWWWGRVGALVLRFIFYTIDLQYGFRFADDFKFLALVRSHGTLVPLFKVLLLMEVLTIPLKWSKTAGGPTTDWIGYWFDYSKLLFGLGAQRAEWIWKWLRNTAADKVVVARDFKSGLGRLGFAAEILRYLKPFTAPLYAWIATVPNGGGRSIPRAILLLMLWMAKAIERKARIPMTVKWVQLGERFRADAKAEGMRVVLGGWEPAGSDTPTERSRWFAVELTPITAPWAVCKGMPFRTIAALELFASLLSVLFLVNDSHKDHEAVLLLSGATDNLGNESVLKRCMTTKFPLCIILMELASQMESKGLQLSLDWCRRDTKVEADSLTNGDYSLFNPSCRVEVDLVSVNWHVLSWLQSEAQSLYEQIRQSKQSLAKQAKQEPSRKKKMIGLRQSDPW